MRIRTTLLAAFALACCIAPRSKGRLLVLPTYQEMLDRSDLVVIATPITRTADTKEQAFLPDVWVQDEHGNRTKVIAIGVETRFKVEVVLKGDTTVREFVLHHYREPSKICKNCPVLVFFDPAALSGREWLLFLIREKDGRYAPTGGQTDPGLRAITSLSPGFG